MVITSLGSGTIRLQNGETVLLVDPTSARFKADATVITASMLSETPIPEKNVITFAGEYEAAGIEIQGFTCGSDASQVTTAYVLTWDGIRVLVVGDHDHLPAGEALEEIGELQPEVLVLPMATAEQASWSAKLAKALEANLVIPSAFASTKDITSAFGETGDTEEKITFKKKDLSAMSQKLVILAPAK
jgi:L-ascorbate metabolism protein UlaG (beta-lactamase superfamily)